MSVDNVDENGALRVAPVEQGLEGVDMSVNNVELLASVTPRKTVVTTAPYKEFRSAFIGLREGLMAGEVIQVGSLNKKYRIIRFVRFTNSTKNGASRIYFVQRIDGNPFTNVDIESISVGDGVKILGRLSFDQLLAAPAARGYVPPCPVEVHTNLPCSDNQKENC